MTEGETFALTSHVSLAASRTLARLVRRRAPSAPLGLSRDVGTSLSRVEQFPRRRGSHASHCAVAHDTYVRQSRRSKARSQRSGFLLAHSSRTRMRSGFLSRMCHTSVLGAARTPHSQLKMPGLPVEPT